MAVTAFNGDGHRCFWYYGVEMTNDNIHGTVKLKPGREKSVLQHHPWIYSGAVEEMRGNPGSGDVVRVEASRGKFLAYGFFSPESSIRVRLLSWTETDMIGPDFFNQRVREAVQLRKDLLSPEDSAVCRLVFGEADGLPGWIVDRYADYLVLQCLTAGAERWRDAFVEELCQVTGIQNVYERSDVDVRKLERLPERKGLLKGSEPPPSLEISESGLKFMVDICSGQKTGFFIDQRENRRLFRSLVRDAKVLNCFCYTGAFSVYAMAGGARSVTSIDSSAEAIETAKQNMALNGFDSRENISWIEGDVFLELRKMRDRNEKFDCIVLDPPKFAATAAQAAGAARGYKDINLLALKLLNPGGLLFTFSCSGGISADLFQKIVAGAALDAGVNARILYHMHQGPDHPVALHFPESAYLKGLVCRADPFFCGL